MNYIAFLVWFCDANDHVGWPRTPHDLKKAKKTQNSLDFS
jgi:hypothetical protein